MTNGEFLDKVLAVRTVHEAEQFLADYVPLVTKNAGNGNPVKGRQIALSNIAYLVGYCDHEARERVERLFGAVHPILGSAYGKQPTLDEVFKMGQDMGQAVAKGKRPKLPRTSKPSVLQEQLIDNVVDGIIGGS
jgi:hypothetical protein